MVYIKSFGELILSYSYLYVYVVKKIYDHTGKDACATTLQNITRG